MSVIGLFAASLTAMGYGSTQLGLTTVGGWQECSPAFAPFSGQRGLTGLGLGNSSTLAAFPNRVTGIPANAGRNWAAWLHTWYFDTPYADIIATDYVNLCKIAFTTTYRQLRLLSKQKTNRTSNTTTGCTGVTSTSITDTAKDFSAAGVVAGDYVMIYNTSNATKHIRGRVTSLTGTTTINVSGWDGGTPSVGDFYQVGLMQFQWSVTDGATEWLGSVHSDPTTDRQRYWITEFKFAPATGAMTLWVNGTQEINVTAGTTGVATGLIYTDFSHTDPGSGKGSNGWQLATNYTGLYNAIMFDDLVVTNSPTDFNSFPVYGATIPADVTKRYLVIGRPLSNVAGVPKYDAWAVTGSDDKAKAVRDNDAGHLDGSLPSGFNASYSVAEYISTTTQNATQSIPVAPLNEADTPLLSTDTFTIYAIQSVGGCYARANGLSDHQFFHSSATADDAGVTQTADNPDNFMYCANVDPDGAAWTYTTANSHQVSIKAVDAGGNAHALCGGFQLILIKPSVTLANTQLASRKRESAALLRASQPPQVAALRI